MRWIQRFLWFCNGAVESVTEDTILAFRHRLQNETTLKDWQLRQADDAVAIYLHQFLRLDLSSNVVESVATTDTGKRMDLLTWDLVLTKARSALRLRHYANQTERTYLSWTRTFAQYVDPAPPADMDSGHVKHFLTHLAVKRRVSSSTQNQAFSALLFLFRHVLRKDIGDLSGSVRAKRGQKLPVVLSRDEVRRVLARMDSLPQLLARLTYGSGLRLSECLRLRVKDLDFDNGTLFVRSGKGDKDRTTFLPGALTEELRRHLQGVKKLHEEDLRRGLGHVELPQALARKYPDAPKEWLWQYVFPSESLSVNPRTGQPGRHHVSRDMLQRALKKAVREAGVSKRVTVHCLRHSFATHLLERGMSIRKIQELLGHTSVETTMIYTHVLQKTNPDGNSPLDDLHCDEQGAASA